MEDQGESLVQQSRSYLLPEHRSEQPDFPLAA